MGNHRSSGEHGGQKGTLSLYVLQMTSNVHIIFLELNKALLYNRIFVKCKGIVSREAAHQNELSDQRN